MTDPKVLWAEIFQDRRRTLAFRVILIFAITLGFGPFADASLLYPWIASYVALQLLERGLGPRVANRRVGAALLFANHLIYCAPALLVIHEFGPWGVGLGAAHICGAMTMAAISARRSPLAYAMMVLPCIGYLAALAVMAFHYGGGIGAAVILGLAVPMALGGTTAAWRASARALEAEAVARAQAEAADAAKSAFMAMVGHELRTPISAMLAGVAEAQKGRDPAEVAANLRLIDDAGRMMRTLLNDLLDYSKLEAGKLELVAEPHNLGALIEQTEAFWGAEARARGLEFRIEHAGELPGWVVIDGVRIRQILNNLLSNALKFTTDGGVTLRTEAIGGEAGWRVALSVIDTGPGLTAQQAEGLFTPFRQADAGVARTHGGTGLGLAISRTLAQLMDGDLTLKTAPGEGCVFTFEALFAPAEPPPAAELAPPRAAGLRILLADDHEVNRRAFALMLGPIAEKLICVEDGEAAIAEVGPFDLVLLDLNMPRMGGLEAAQHIAARPGAPPILALTASIDPADIAACRAAGMTGFVAKPVEPEELYAAIEAAFAA
jgi:signal transduction histidine kinase